MTVKWGGSPRFLGIPGGWGAPCLWVLLRGSRYRLPLVGPSPRELGCALLNPMLAGGSGKPA